MVAIAPQALVFAPFCAPHCRCTCPLSAGRLRAPPAPSCPLSRWSGGTWSAAAWLRETFTCASPQASQSDDSARLSVFVLSGMPCLQSTQIALFLSHSQLVAGSGPYWQAFTVGNSREAVQAVSINGEQLEFVPDNNQWLLYKDGQPLNTTAPLDLALKGASGELATAATRQPLLCSCGRRFDVDTVCAAQQTAAAGASRGRISPASPVRSPFLPACTCRAHADHLTAQPGQPHTDWRAISSQRRRPGCQ